MTFCMSLPNLKRLLSFVNKIAAFCHLRFLKYSKFNWLGSEWAFASTYQISFWLLESLRWKGSFYILKQRLSGVRYLWFLKFKRSSTNRVETSGCLHYLAILRCDSLNLWGEMTILKCLDNGRPPSWYKQTSGGLGGQVRPFEFYPDISNCCGETVISIFLN